MVVSEEKNQKIYMCVHVYTAELTLSVLKLFVAICSNYMRRKLGSELVTKMQRLFLMLSIWIN